MPAILPRLIHPQPVVIKRMSQATTAWDQHYREPVTNPWPETGGGGAPIKPDRSEVNYLTSVTLEAQVKYTRAKAAEMTKDGDAPRGDGYLLFRASSLLDAGVTLNKGDVCIQVNTFEVDYYFVDIVPVGHYEKPHFIKAVFIRRKSGIAGARRGGLG